MNYYWKEYNDNPIDLALAIIPKTLFIKPFSSEVTSKRGLRAKNYVLK